MEQARAFAQRRLGPLAAGDENTRRLADTLLAVLEEQGSPRRAARRLDVHENTVAKRLRAVDDLLGEIDRSAPELLAALLILRALR
jgi:DNA-binding PucR family transcriptional regulator